MTGVFHMDCPNSDSQNIQISKGEYEMNMPKTLAAWCTILFFVVFALDAFGIFGNEVVFGLLAAGIAVFTFLGI